MTQHKRAYYAYKAGDEYLCEVMAADLRPFPSFGSNAPSSVLKIVLLVRSRVIAPGTIEPVGHQAVTWVLVDKDLCVIGDDAARFVREAGIRIRRGEKPEIDENRVVACEFGEPDLEFGFQPLIRGRPVNPASYGTAPVPKPAGRKPFGLQWNECTRFVWRKKGVLKKEAGFGGHSIPFKILLYIINHTYSDNYGNAMFCSTDELLHHIWDKASRDEPTCANTLQKHIGFIRGQIKPLGLSIECERSKGYKLTESDSRQRRHPKRHRSGRR